MKLTNLFNLPQPIYDAVANDPYTKGDSDYSITGLMKPPRMVALEKAHWNEIEEDASDRIFSLLGQAVHTILERSERIAIAEKRLYASIDGVRISGQTDRIVVLDRLVQDYKVTSVWKILKGEYEDWAAQQNAYRWLLKENGYDIEALQIVAILRDWSKRKARTEDKYPVAQIAVVELPVWPLERTREMLRLQIAQHEAAKVNLPLCTPEEKWQDPGTWAVMKPGAKRATKLCSTLEEAERYACGGSFEITRRISDPRRCFDYCRVAKFCEQHQNRS